MIIVSELNAALIVNAGPDQIVTAGEQVQLDGSASSETDGNIASFHWYQVRGPVVTLESARTAIASF
ncbi:MAG: PKD domain-containing protein [Candidatus Thiodiazotropha sp.]